MPPTITAPTDLTLSRMEALVLAQLIIRELGDVTVRPAMDWIDARLLARRLLEYSKVASNSAPFGGG